MRAIAAAVARSARGRVDILEVGSWAGRSAVTWARALAEHNVKGLVVCVDHWKRYLDVDQNDEAVYREMTSAVEADRIYELFRHNIRVSGNADRVVWIRADSGDILPHLAPGTFQIAFIDASHRYEDVVRDIRHATVLVADGGILCGDDLELQIDDCAPETLREGSVGGIDYCRDPRTGLFYHPGVTRAVAEQLGRVSMREGFWAVRRSGDSWAAVDLPEDGVHIPEHVCEADYPEAILTPLVVGSYNVLRAGERYFAVSQTLGEVDVLREPLGCRDLPPHLLIGDSLEDVSLRARALTTSDHVELVEEFEGYNLLKLGARVCAVAQSLGPTAPLRERIGERELPGILLLDADFGVLKRRIREAARAHAERQLAIEEERAQLREAANASDEHVAALLGQQAQADAERQRLSDERETAVAVAYRSREAVARLQSELHDRGRALEQAREQLQRTAAELERTRAEFHRTRDELDRTGAGLRRDLDGANQTLAQLTLEREELYAFIDRIQAQLIDVKSRRRLAALWRRSPHAPARP
jgi:predicted O-methyltransferase YrrM